MLRIKSFLIATSMLATSTIAANADIQVVASIKPVHSLVSAVMQGVGEPGLIVDGASSPHNYSLKPSQAKMLESANVVFWVGHDLEPFLEKPLETVGANAKAVELIDAHDLVKLEFREGGAFEKHDHGDEDHDDHDHDKHEEHADHDGHDHDKHEEHADHEDHGHDKHEEHAGHEDHDHDKHEDHASHDDHDHGEHDPHVWLDPMNAKAMVHEIEETLVAADPDNAAKYEANADAVMAQLEALSAEVAAELASVKDGKYFVFHDAYQYFEKRFGLTASGSITVSPEVVPGAKRVREIQDQIKEAGVSCVFSEPQFEPKLIATVTEGTPVKSGILDPLGTGIENGPELYFDLIKNMAASIKSCLTPTG